MANKKILMKASRLQWSHLLSALAMSACALSSSWVSANPTAKIKQLQLNDLISLALENNAEVQISKNETQAAAGQLSTARAIPNPQFETLRGDQKRQGGSVSTVESLSVTQPIDMPYMRVPRVNAAEKNLKAIEASELLKRHEIVARVKTRYYEYIRRVEELKAANEDLDLTRQIRDRIRLRYQVGETAKFELIRAETDLLNVQINTQAAKSRLDQAKAQLRLVVGTKNLPTQFEIKFQDIPKDNLPSLETLLAEVKAQNPEINRARLQLESNQSRLSLERNTRLPQLAFKGQENKEPDFTNRSYGVVVTIPIWDWRIGQVREAAANVARSQNQLNYQTQLLETQLELAYEQYEISSYQVRTLENEVIQQATDARRIAEASFRFGERGLLEYLDAQRTLRAARADLIRAKFELASIIIEIERLRANPDNLLVKANP